jgi:frataxin-like iron-binding protein CyaY
MAVQSIASLWGAGLVGGYNFEYGALAKWIISDNLTVPYFICPY